MVYTDSAVDAYRVGLIDTAEDLRRFRAFSRHLGSGLTRDEWERGRSLIGQITRRYGAPSFPPLFLYLLKNPNLWATLDRCLEEIESRTREKILSRLATETVPVLAELSLYQAARADGVFAGWFPGIPGTMRQADLAIAVAGNRVFVEVTVLTQGQFWDGVDVKAAKSPSGTWVGTGPGPHHEALRVHAKVAEELNQVAPGEPNILVMIFREGLPSHTVLDEVLSAPMLQWRGEKCRDLSNRRHLDSIWAFNREELRGIYISPDAQPASRLSDDHRLRIRAALWRLPFAVP